MQSSSVFHTTRTLRIKHAPMPPLQRIVQFNGMFFHEAEKYYFNPHNTLAQLEKIPNDWTLFRRKQNNFFLLKNTSSMNNPSYEQGGGGGQNDEENENENEGGGGDFNSAHFTGNRVVGLMQSMLCMPIPRYFPPEGMRIEDYKDFIASPDNQGTMVVVTREESIGILIIGPDGNPRVPPRSFLQAKNTRVSGSHIKMPVTASFFTEIFDYMDQHKELIEACQTWYVRSFGAEMWERLKRAKHFREQAQDEVDNPKPPIVVESTGVDMGRPTYHFKRKGRDYAFDEEENGNLRSAFFSDPRWCFLSERSGQLRENDVKYGSGNPLDINMQNAVGCCRKGHFSTSVMI